jgi:putative oxidoreductase
MFAPLVEGRVALGLLLLRLIVGYAFILHGLPKIEHPTSWMRGSAVLAVPPWLQAIVALAEFGGGIALIAGFLTPLAAFLILCDMTVVVFVISLPHGMRFVGGPRSFENAGVYLVVMLAFLVTGPGAYSLDAVIFRGRKTTARRASGATR